jgi:uncharacterized protein YjbI with pentapeptide repeats
VEGTLDLAQAKFKKGLKLDYAKINQAIDATLADFGNELQISDSEFNGSNLFRRCTVTGVSFFVRVSGDDFKFSNAEFSGNLAAFIQFDFRKAAWFDATIFNCPVSIQQIRTDGQAFFHETEFRDSFLMDSVKLSRASFLDIRFSKSALIKGVDASSLTFTRAEFVEQNSIGPIMTSGYAAFRETIFRRRVELQILAAELDFTGTVFEQGATVVVKYAKASFENASFGAESTITSAGLVSWVTYEMKIRGKEVSFDETELIASCGDPRVKIASLRGVDVSPLLLVNVSLACCLFAGSYNLDKLRIEAPKPFADTPRGVQIGRGWPPIWRWTRRQCLAEEYEWRRSLSKPFGWSAAVVKPPNFMLWEHQRKIETLDAERLTAIYRSLRKSLEDNKNEPGAADFYYGEMEARRRSIATPRVERLIIWVYWIISGYSLRGLRSFTCLGLSVIGLAWLMYKYGFAITGEPVSYFKSLIYTASATASINYDQITLTEWGQIVRIAVRILGPLFLGLTIFSVRNRIKR